MSNSFCLQLNKKTCVWDLLEMLQLWLKYIFLFVIRVSHDRVVAYYTFVEHTITRKHFLEIPKHFIVVVIFSWSRTVDSLDFVKKITRFQKLSQMYKIYIIVFWTVIIYERCSLVYEMWSIDAILLILYKEKYKEQ